MTRYVKPLSGLVRRRRVTSAVAALAFLALVGGWLFTGGPDATRAAQVQPAPFVPTAAPISTASLQARFDNQIKPLFAKHCNSCHAGGKHKGDVSLDKYPTLLSVQNDRERWLHFAEVLKQKLMPPEEKPQPTQAEFDAMVSWITDTVNFCDCSGPRDPGRVMVHRLNRTEYNNTIRDLLGVRDFEPAKDFPADDTGYGFDNIADVLTVSPLLIEKYLAAAEQATEKVIPSADSVRPQVKRYGEAMLKPSGAGNEAFRLVAAGDTSFTHAFAVDGQYEVSLRGSQRKLGNEDAEVAVRVDGKAVGTMKITGTRERPATAKVRFDAKAGNRPIALVLTNPKSEENAQTRRTSTRTVVIDVVEVHGPFNAAPPPPTAGFRKIFISKPGPGVTEEAAARAILTRFTTRAYRRPAAADEVEGLMKVFRAVKADGETFEQSVRAAIMAVLVSPQFLFRIELDPPATVAAGNANPQPYLLNEYEFVTRLSYFLWSAPPDDDLLLLAQNKKIRDPKVLEEQVKRMLADSRATALVENFAGQWLELRNLDDYTPDKAIFSSWDDSLRQSMKKETELFFQTIVREDRSILELLNADYTYVNDRLARHYGIPNVTGPEFRRVSLTGTKRGGVLTQASVLTVTAMPTRTSPVKRGKFILENILGAPPPPPPPDVAPLSEAPKDISKATLKVRTEEHRKDPNCAVCHIKMDAIGFSLENFNAIGQWRDRDGLFPVDSSGKLPDGLVLNGSDGLKKMLLSKQTDFVSTVVKKLLTYGMGRGLEWYDQCTVKDIEQSVRQQNYKFSALVVAIVKSDAFQKRRLLRADEMRIRQEKADDLRDRKDK